MRPNKLWMWLGIVAIVALYVLASATLEAADAPDPNEGLRLWALAGGGVQEARIGYEGWLPDVELAFGAQHLDAPDDGIEEWPLRGYLLVHALDADMVASAFGTPVNVPDGNLYGGLFAQYVYDRDDEFSGGYVIGGLVDWPKNWQTVAEYQHTVWNTGDDVYELVLGLRRRF